MQPSGSPYHPRAFRQVAPAATCINLLVHTERADMPISLWPAAAADWREGWSGEGTSGQHHQHREWRRGAGALIVRRA